MAKGNKTRGRGYSVVEDRESIITKALTFVMKRTVTEDEEQAEGDEKLVADGEDWVDVEDIVSFTPPFTFHIPHLLPQLIETITITNYFRLYSSPTPIFQPSK